jgi:putative addiction module component (TIGR02574 family)
MSKAHPELFDLPLADKLRLVEDLWDSIASGDDQLPIPGWHLRELDRREQEQSSNPETGSSWDEVKARIRERRV